VIVVCLIVSNVLIVLLFGCFAIYTAVYMDKPYIVNVFYPLALISRVVATLNWVKWRHAFPDF
jgi:hypothetical protein